MSGNGNWQKMLQEKRLQHQLEIQSRQIETVLSENEVEAQVYGGFVQPRSIRFDLSAHLEAGLSKLRFIKQDILTALGVSELDIVQAGGRWQLHVKRPDDPPVSLLDMLPILPELSPLSIVLGMNEAGTPVLSELSTSFVPNVLISGDDEAGKTSLLKTIAMSLALTNKQSQLQLAVLDASGDSGPNNGRQLDPLSYLPHMLTAVTVYPEEHRELLTFLSDEMQYRQEQQMVTPAIVVLVDEVVTLLQALKPKEKELFTKLLQRGASVGIHFILSTRDLHSPLLTQSMRFNLPLKLVGKSESGDELLSEHDLIQSSYLLGKGDFIAIQDGELIHFQAAFIGDYDLHLSLETLHRNRPTPILAHSYMVMNDFAKEQKDDVSLINFEVSKNKVTIGTKEEIDE